MSIAVTLKDKRLNLIRAVQDLGIDKDSVCLFLRSSIEAERKCLELTGPLMSPEQLNKRVHALIEADLIRLTLEHF